MNEDINMDAGLVPGYALSGAFGVIGLIQMATEDLTGIGMICIAAFSAWSTHEIKRRRLAADKRLERAERQAKQRERELEDKIQHLLRRLPCGAEGGGKCNQDLMTIE